MTGSAKARRHKRWLYERELRKEFRGSELVALINLLKDEMAGMECRRLPEHQLAYDRLMLFMPEILDSLGDVRRADSYKMVLSRAWKKMPMVYFDHELFDELALIVKRASSMLWRENALPRINVDLKTQTIAMPARQMRLNFRTYESTGYGVFNVKALRTFQRMCDNAPSIHDILSGPPRMYNPGISMGCKVTP